MTERRASGPVAPDAALEPRFPIEEPAQVLADCLRSIARRTGASLIIDARAVDGLASRPVYGTLSALDAVRRALEGATGIVAVPIGGIIVVRKVDSVAGPVRGAPES